MSCVVESFCGQYVACCLLPLSTNSICCGSNSLGVHIARTDKNADSILSIIVSTLNLKPHIVSQVCDELQVETVLPYSVEIHKYSTRESSKVYWLHHSYKLWVRYAFDTYLRPEIMTTHSSSDVVSGFIKFTWKYPVKCSECNKYVEDYDYYSYERVASERRAADYLCCLSCYTMLFPSRNFKVPFARLMRKTLPPPMRQVYWKDSCTGEITAQLPSKRIALNPDSFDSLSYADPVRTEDQSVIGAVFDKVKNDLVEELIEELNTNQDYMIIDAEHLGRIAHNKGINLKFLGRLALKACSAYIKEIACTLALSRGIKRLVLNAVASIKDSQDPRDVVLSYLNHVFSVVETMVSKKIWTLLTDYIQSHWGLTIEKSILNKLHIPSLAIATCKQLHISFQKLFEANYMSLVPFAKENLTLLPTICDETYTARSIDLLIFRARELDRKGRKAHWYAKGGPERVQALALMEKALQIAGSVYQKNSVNYADVALECAKTVESLHVESGNPKNSKWNKAAKIPPSKYSEQAEYYYELALQIYEKEEMSHKKMIECLLGMSRLAAVKSVTSIINLIEEEECGMHPEGSGDGERGVWTEPHLDGGNKPAHCADARRECAAAVRLSLGAQKLPGLPQSRRRQPQGRQEHLRPPQEYRA
eukprot:TRINITY_DN964_c0_g1_i17.p1 TRINITY_DN964_c0_g1~~TRINITY_DN964_c0_g1_i17.p1  ORF type:complete len:649 (+),score=113.42 TRINITY_DN964_c0_g1_i17:758-2704(+)